MSDGPVTADNALAIARDVLRRAPLIDGHNDLPWVIRVDRTARGDVVAYDLNRIHERTDTDIPRLREGMVGAQFWAAFQPTNAPTGAGPLGSLPSSAPAVPSPTSGSSAPSTSGAPSIGSILNNVAGTASPATTAGGGS